MRRKKTHSVAKDFIVKSTHKSIREPESPKGTVIIFHNGEPALTSTIDFSVAYETVKKLMLQILYIKTLESPEEFMSYQRFEDYADAETVNGVKRNAERATRFENCLRNERWMEWFGGIAADATQFMLSNLAVKIFNDCMQLAHEAAIYTLDHVFYPPETARELDKETVKVIREFESKQTGKRAGFKRGGDRRSKPEWRKADTVEQYRQRVKELRPLWEFVKKFYKRNSDDESWMSMLKESSRFKSLSRNCHTVPTELLKHLADKESDKREREPLALALEHARQELTLPRRDSETLRGYYTGRRSKGIEQ